MINYSQPLLWEPPLTPPCDSFEDYKKKFILSRIEDFAKAVISNGIESSKIGCEDNDLIDTLYEYIEDSIEKFLPEATYDV